MFQITSCNIPFTSDSNVDAGLRIRAALGGGLPHVFQVDTGSVGILVPRHALGPDYQEFDPSRDVTFGYVSSENMYHGQWVRLPAVLGVPASWDGTGDFPVAELEVFAVDQPANFKGGVLGIGFAIGGSADDGPLRNPLLHLKYIGKSVSAGYIVSTNKIEVGPGPSSTTGFALIQLERDSDGSDWRQPIGSIQLTENLDSGHFSAELPFLMDTGIAEMILWIKSNHPPLDLPRHSAFHAGVTARISVPTVEPALQYSFVTGDTSQPMAPSHVEWRAGHGINTGRRVLAGAEYLYDSVAGHIGFRMIGA